MSFLLVHRSAFTREYVSENILMRQFRPVVAEVLAGLGRGVTPALAGVMDRCAVFQTRTLVVLQAACVAQAAGSSQ